MGPLPPYQELYPVGTRVRVATEDVLRKFTRPAWKFHHPLQPEQLEFANEISTVSRVNFYHGGDVLYHLENSGDYWWHELCLLSS
jgi:hypothetical protein